MKKANKIIDFFKSAPGGFFGLLSTSLGGTFIFLSYVNFPNYDMMKYDISVLGIGPGLSGPLFNIGLILVGITLIPFFFNLGNIMQQESNKVKLTKFAKVLSIVGCISMSLIGCFPVINFTMGVIHAFLALIFFISTLIFLIIFSKLMLDNPIFSNAHSYYGFIVAGLIIFYVITRWSFVEWIVFFALGIWIIDISIFTSFIKENK